MNIDDPRQDCPSKYLIWRRPEEGFQVSNKRDENEAESIMNILSTYQLMVYNQ